MKSSPRETGSTDRKLLPRLHAFIRPVKRKAYRLSAQVTGEEDWEVDEPQIRMSRAFIVMLVLHLVAVGGLFGFHVYGKDDREAEGLATRSAHASSAPAPAAVAVAAPAAPEAAVIPRAEIVPEDAPASDEVGAQGQHIVQAGETKALVASKFGITPAELEAANPGAAFERGDVLTIPAHERVIGAAGGAPAPLNQPLAIIVATPSEEVGHRDFALKAGAENPYAPVAVADPEPVVAPVVAAARAAVVKAEPTGGERPARPETPSRSAAAAVKPKAAAAPVPVMAKTKPSTGSRTHVVQKGDTVYNVAKRYGLSPNEVMLANGITDASRVQMGQVLKIAVKR